VLDILNDQIIIEFIYRSYKTKLYLYYKYNFEQQNCCPNNVSLKNNKSVSSQYFFMAFTISIRPIRPPNLVWRSVLISTGSSPLPIAVTEDRTVILAIKFSVNLHKTKYRLLHNHLTLNLFTWNLKLPFTLHYNIQSSCW
jgi:hypothetical protein